MLVELSQQLSFKDCFLSEEKSQLIYTGMLENIQVNIFDLFFVKILLDYIKNFLIFQSLLADIQNLNIFSKN